MLRSDGHIRYGSPPRRSDLASYGQYLIALVLFVGGVIAWAWRWRLSVRGRYGPPTVTELDELADSLAQVVMDEWTRAANERRLLAPGPIPVQWRWPSVPIAEAVPTVVAARGFQPLTGMTAVTAERLKGGEIQELHELYGGVGSGRLVITGAPGSGKSGAAVLLILAALRHREEAGEADRSKVPVPVMFTFMDGTELLSRSRTGSQSGLGKAIRSWPVLSAPRRLGCFWQRASSRSSWTDWMRFLRATLRGAARAQPAGHVSAGSLDPS